MAISIDKTIHDEFSERRASPIPTRTVPGYVPGMPRPMTPRDFDFDEQRSHSTTPRAQSPFPDPPASPTLANISTTKIRRASITSTARPSPVTPMSAAPLFLQRSTNGRYTPDDSQQRLGSGDAADLDNDLSSIATKRRPASPLSSPPFQPMAVTNRPLSRPTTPSNVIWTPNSHKNNPSGHSRNTSWTTDGGTSSSDFYNSNGQSKPARSSRSSALPDSPIFDFNQSAPLSFSSAASSSISQIDSSERPHAFLPDISLGSPGLVSTHSPRSGTPTQNTSQRSPISSTFSSIDLSPRNGGSRRSSRQNPPSSPFNISSFPSLGFAPRANSSRSSLDSVGSSFHSWDETDKVLSVFSDSKEQQPVAWHDFGANKSSFGTPGNGSPDEEEWDAEKVIQRYAGLKRADIAAIQEKLVIAAFTKIANTDPRDRAPSSMRRRRPSTSQSNYPRVSVI
jgi:serine/arginine repetitive matrix protein 2